MRGLLALRLVLPALLSSILASAVAWCFLPDVPTYRAPEAANTLAFTAFAALAGPIAGVASVLYVRLITSAHRHRPSGRARLVAPIVALTLLGVASTRFPELLGNGKDIVQGVFSASFAPVLVLALVALKPAATTLCLGSGAPGGLFTATLSFGALLGGVLALAWSALGTAVVPAACAVVVAAAVLGATTQGPLSAIVLVMELIGRDRSYVVPMIVAVVLATLVSRTIEPRSIYDARLTDEQVRARRAPSAPSGA
ncbi:MAG TPA: chloride channel protein, partial [Minicystis sp.]|nr:chloride channel protein [Minicystis sp.]